MRKTFTELRNEFFKSFPDPSTDQIDGGRLYDLIQDVLDTLQPAYGVLSTIGAPISGTIGTSPVLVPWELKYWETAPEFVVNQAAGSITFTRPSGVVRITLTIDIGVAVNRALEFTIFANGVATPWRMQITGTGVTKPDAVGLVAILNPAVPTTYTIMASADQANTAAEFSNAVFVVENVPVGA